MHEVGNNNAKKATCIRNDLGIGWAQTWHWNEKKKISDWYKANAQLREEV